MPTRRCPPRLLHISTWGPPLRRPRESLQVQDGISPLTLFSLNLDARRLRSRFYWSFGGSVFSQTTSFFPAVTRAIILFTCKNLTVSSAKKTPRRNSVSTFFSHSNCVTSEFPLRKLSSGIFANSQGIVAAIDYTIRYDHVSASARCLQDENWKHSRSLRNFTVRRRDSFDICCSSGRRLPNQVQRGFCKEIVPVIWSCRAYARIRLPFVRKVSLTSKCDVR